MALKLICRDYNELKNFELKIKGYRCEIQIDRWSLKVSKKQLKEFWDSQNIEPRRIRSFPRFLALSIVSTYPKLEEDIVEQILSNSRKRDEIKNILSNYVFYIYKNNLYYFDDKDLSTPEEQVLLIKEYHYKREKKFKKLKREIRLFEKLSNYENKKTREPIPEDIRFFVWRRDKGRCVKCDSKENLEFDHIIPISKGGSNTERNIQLLCQKCNRKKSSKI